MHKHKIQILTVVIAKIRKFLLFYLIINLMYIYIELFEI